MNQDLGDDWHHKYHKDVHPPSTKATWRLQAQAALQVTFRKITNSDDTLTIIYFNLYNCKELTDTDIIQYLDGKENKKTNKYLSDKGMMEYLQIFADIVIKVIIRRGIRALYPTWITMVYACLFESTFIQF